MTNNAVQTQSLVKRELIPGKGLQKPKDNDLIKKMANETLT